MTTQSIIIAYLILNIVLVSISNTSGTWKNLFENIAWGFFGIPILLILLIEKVFVFIRSKDPFMIAFWFKYLFMRKRQTEKWRNADKRRVMLGFEWLRERKMSKLKRYFFRAAYYRMIKMHRS